VFWLDLELAVFMAHKWHAQEKKQSYPIVPSTVTHHLACIPMMLA